MPRFEKCRIQARWACLRLSTTTKHARAKGCPFETLRGYALVTDGLWASVLAPSCGRMGKASKAVLLAGCEESLLALALGVVFGVERD